MSCEANSNPSSRGRSGRAVRPWPLLAALFLLLAALPAHADRGGCKRAGKHCRWDRQCCAGLICGGGQTCQPGCRIDGALYVAGATNPANPCQACGPAASTTAWSAVPDGTLCDDASACTADDACRAGACTGGLPPACDDGNLCTVDSCDDAVGCINTHVGDGSACEMWVTDGPVWATALHGDTLYIGGEFRWVSPAAVGSFVPFDPDTGGMRAGFPVVLGEVMAAVPDGAGGWYIGGSFTQVGGLERSGLAHVLADGTVADWNPCEPQEGVICFGRGPNGLGVNAVAVGDGVVYAAGTGFVHGDTGEFRHVIAAFDAQTGRLTPWDPTPSLLAVSDGQTLAVKGAKVYLGAWGGLAEIDAITAEARVVETTLSPAFGFVSALALHGDTLQVGGNFTSIDGMARQNLASIDLATWRVTPWDPQVVGDYQPGSLFAINVSALAIAGDTMYAGGNFHTIGGLPRDGLAAIDLRTGGVTSWQAALASEWGRDNGVALAAAHGRLYAAPAGDRDIAAIDGATGRILDWNAPLHRWADVLGQGRRTIGIDGAGVWVGGFGFNVGGVERLGIAAIDLRTGRPTDWNPGSCLEAWVRPWLLAATDERIHAIGWFPGAGPGQFQSRLASFPSVASPAPCAEWSQPIRQARALATDGESVFVGCVGSCGPAGLTEAFAAATGAPTAWNPNLLGGWISDIEVENGTVYLGGRITSSHGEPRTNLAAADAVTGLPRTWAPAAPTSNGVSALEVAGGLVYVSGRFDSINGEPRRRFGAVDAVTGQVAPWYPEFSDDYASHFEMALGSSDGVVYMGNVAVDAVTGAATSWDPGGSGDYGRGFLGSEPGSHWLAAGEGVVYMGGQYGLIGGQLRRGIAAVAGVTGAAAPPRTGARDVAVPAGRVDSLRPAPEPSRP